jgi:signal transduction histidine kinase
MAGLLARLATAARVSLGQVNLQLAEADLAWVLGVTVARLDPAAAARLRLELPPDGEATGLWDAAGLGQVVENLLSNALKYSPVDAPVHVALRPGDDAVELCVRDQGIGLTRDEVGRLFRRYERAPAAVESGVPGAGLGLYLARAVVDAHGGPIWAESPGSGQGTTLHVLLPRSGRPSPTAPTRRGTASRAPT